MTSLTAVAGALGGVLALCLVVILILSVYCCCLRRKQEKDDTETQRQSESEYFEAIDFSKIRKNLPQTNPDSTVSNATSSKTQAVSVSKEPGAVKAGYHNKPEVTSSYDGSEMEYYNTAHTLLGNSTKTVQYCNVNAFDNENFQNDENSIDIHTDEMKRESSKLENSSPPKISQSYRTEFEQNERSDRESYSESQSDNYFVLIKEDKPRYTIGQSPKGRPNAEISETDREYVEIGGPESKSTIHIDQDIHISSAYQYVHNDEAPDNMYFVLAKQ